MNYSDLAKSFGFEIDQEFLMTYQNNIVKAKFTEEGLKIYKNAQDGSDNVQWWGEASDALLSLFAGREIVINELWKPKKGDTYYYMDMNTSSEEDIKMVNKKWEDTLFDYVQYNIANCFRYETENELPRYKALFKSHQERFTQHYGIIY